MKWFDRWFAHKCKWAWENKDIFEEKRTLGSLVARADDSADWGDGLRIQVKRVHGGHIVTFKMYDHKTDRNNDQHYIITSEQDFNLELGKLITLESMRQS